MNIGIAEVLDVYGIEAQVQSLNNPKYSTWILISAQKGENSDQVNQDSFKPVFGNPMPGSENSDSVVTKEKPSSQLRETAASWNDSESVSVHSKTESNRRDKNIRTFNKKEIPMKDIIWTTIPGFFHKKRNFIETHISKEVTYMVRHCHQDERAKRWSNALGSDTPDIDEKIPESIE